jgi:hypothetical protein
LKELVRKINKLRYIYIDELYDFEYDDNDYRYYKEYHIEYFSMKKSFHWILETFEQIIIIKTSKIIRKIEDKDDLKFWGNKCYRFMNGDELLNDITVSYTKEKIFLQYIEYIYKLMLINYKDDDNYKNRYDNYIKDENIPKIVKDLKIV